MITVLDICTGVGGFTAAHEMVGGFRTIAFSEINPWCCGFLKWWKPDVPNLGDLKAIQECEIERLGPIDVVCGGIPCQPHSVAGKRQGFEDPRDLWPAARRIVGIVRPGWVLLENVDGFRAMALDRVCADMESDGYDIGAYCIPACAVDAPHERMRVWIVARIVGNAHSQRQLQPGGTVPDKRKWAGDAGADGAVEQSASQQRPARNSRPLWTGTAQIESKRSGLLCGSQPSNPELQFLPTFRSGWTGCEVITGPDSKARRVPQSSICGLADGAVAPDALLTSSYRGRAAELRAIGNAIVPAVAARFFYSIRKNECLKTA